MFGALLGYQVEGTLITDNVGPLSLTFDYEAGIGRQLFFKGAFEQTEIAFVRRLLAKFSELPVLFDVGANIGVHTLSWASSCRHLFAFEPSPATRNILARNVASNRLADRVSVVPKAISNREGTATFHVCKDNALSSLKDTRRNGVAETVSVEVTTLDTFAREQKIERVDFIKIDVEGFETEVLEGAKTILSTMKPDLFVEIYGGTASNPDPERTIRFVTSLGYQAFVMIEGRMVPFARHDDRHYNYYFSFAPVL
jgi:FkbM family methyltransferase